MCRTCHAGLTDKRRLFSLSGNQSPLASIRAPIVSGLVILTAITGCQSKLPPAIPTVSNPAPVAPAPVPAAAPAAVPDKSAVSSSSPTEAKSSTPAPDKDPTSSNPEAAAKPLDTQAVAAKPELKPTTPARRTTGKAADLLNADPETIYLVTQTAETWNVATTADTLPADQFAVIAADPLNNSTTFVVDSIESSTASNSRGTSRESKSEINLPKGFVPLIEWGTSAEGLPLRIRCEKTKSMLALVPGGPSILGSDSGPPECRPAVKLRIDPFYMETLEVTVDDFERYRTEQKENKKTVPPRPVNTASSYLTPALGVTLPGAQAYARWAGMELPTEAEFEKAARGPTGLRTPWGDGKSLVTRHGIEGTGQNPEDKSPFGIFDLAANAKEWCVDHYAAAGHKEAAAASREALLNWTGAKTSREANQRVVKGLGDDFSVWNREGKDSNKGDNEVGFRCVLRILREDGPGTSKKPPMQQPKSKTKSNSPGF